MTTEATAFTPALYDDVEVQPVINTGEYCEPLSYGEKDRATFWTVYGHLKTGGVEALVDCVDEQNADRCAAILNVALLQDAAGDVLEALTYFRNIASDWPSSVRKGYVKQAFAKADAAIAKATGMED